MLRGVAKKKGGGRIRITDIREKAPTQKKDQNKYTDTEKPNENRENSMKTEQHFNEMTILQK